MSELLNSLTTLAIMVEAKVTPNKAEEIEVAIHRYCDGLMSLDGVPARCCQILYFGKTKTKNEFVVITRTTLTDTDVPEDAEKPLDIIQLICKIDYNYTGDISIRRLHTFE